MGINPWNVRNYMPLKEIRGMNYTELERWWEVDFNVLIRSAIADATGSVHPSVREALRSEDWVSQWSDALYAATGELSSANERMEILGDGRLRKNTQVLRSVYARDQEASKILREMRDRQGQELAPPHISSAKYAVYSILLHHYRSEFQDIFEDLMRKKGLPLRHRLDETSYSDGLHAAEVCVREGIIHAPTTPEVEHLIQLMPYVVTRVVAKDATKQEDRCDGLRHPLMIRSWADALRHLRDRHCELAGMNPNFSVYLPSLNMKEMKRMEEGDAMTIVNRRRFIRSLAQRWRENRMYEKQLSRTATMRINKEKSPWLEAHVESKKILADRHPEDYAPLLRALKPFCLPGTTDFDQEKFSAKDRYAAIRMLKEAIKNNTLKNL